MAAHYDAETRTVGDLHDWQMVLLDARRNCYLFCVSGNDFSLAGDHLCLCHGRCIGSLVPKQDQSSNIGVVRWFEERLHMCHNMVVGTCGALFFVLAQFIWD